MQTSGRFFIAVDLNSEIKARIARLQEGMKALGAPVKWVAHENCHITLKFLGNISLDKLEEVSKALEKSLAGHAPFLFTITAPGAFPAIQRPRVIWVGVRDEGSHLKRMAADIEKFFAKRGFPREEKAFHPHVTLGRVKLPGRTEALTGYLSREREDIGLIQRAEAVTLFQSELRPSGPVYTSIKVFTLPSSREE